MPGGTYRRLPDYGGPGPPPTAVTAYPPRSLLPFIILITTVLGFLSIYFLIPTNTLFPKPRPSGTGGDLGGYPRGYKLAACYSGQVRTLDKVYEQNYKEMKEFDAGVDVFFVVDLQDNYTVKDGSVYGNVHSMDEMKTVMEYMGSDVLETYEDAKIQRPPKGGCFEREFVDDLRHYTHNFLEFWGMKKCYDVVKREEEKKGVKYDWILHLHPGMVVKIVKPPKDVPLRVHMSGAAAALVPRKMADAYFGVVNGFYDSNCEELDLMSPQVCKNYSYEPHSSECLIVKVLKRYDIVPSNGHYVNRRRVEPTT